MTQPACKCDHPQICPVHKKRVYRAQIAACKATGKPTVIPTCRDCQHQGEAILAANGKQVGSAGCGCTSLSRPSGLLWWACNARDGQAVREDRAASCEEFTAK